MEREQFAASTTGTWWLLEGDVDYRLEQHRRDLGMSFGWADPTWYIEPTKLEQVYDFVRGNRADLLYEFG